MLKMSTQALQRLRQVIFPPACPICATIFDAAHLDGCCAACLAGIKVMRPHVCHRCGTPMPASLAPGPCGTCLGQSPPQQHTHSLFVYRDAVRQALLAWKLQGQSAGMTWLLNSASQHLQHTFSAADLLIPVPMPIHRMRRSGLHHSADLCQHIARLTGAQVDWQMLRRKGVQQRQSAIQGKARLANLRKAFTLADDYKNKLQSLPKQGKIWVVDDILTTGATLRHACRAMQPIGCPVYAFALARTLRNEQES